MGNHLGNWSRIHEKANHISQMTEVSQSPMASCTGFRIRYRRKTARTKSLITISIRYGLILLDAMGIFRESGCLASSSLHRLLQISAFYMLFLFVYWSLCVSSDHVIIWKRIFTWPFLDQHNHHDQVLDFPAVVSIHSILRLFYPPISDFLYSVTIKIR